MPDTPPSERLLYSVSYDRTLFERFGSFREDLREGEDTDFNAAHPQEGKTHAIIQVMPPGSTQQQLEAGLERLSAAAEPPPGPGSPFLFALTQQAPDDGVET